MSLPNSHVPKHRRIVRRVSGFVLDYLTLMKLPAWYAALHEARVTGVPY